MEKLCLPTFDGVSDPSAHVTSFNIVMRRANLSDEEKDVGFCQLFVLLKRKAAIVSASKTDLRTTLNKSKARKAAHTVDAPSLQPQITRANQF
ncbi:hypothetical protein Bca52824_048444 [Brassica carinata]|uniref:Uncharacterized protein n=1 Tax=Brassica carinata TaxID=52824 RepID=A0A8X7UQW8_BRACI|nr:hypothetical protein Bca52824_048444 [Brassica carinata]